jgi:YD repeat-containing protein
MSAARLRLRGPAGLAAAIVLISVALGAVAQAATTYYTYDALGRLREVRRPDGVQSAYTYDASGNRIDVQEGTPPTAPASIYVPGSSSSSSYTISWTAPTSGTVSRYELYESTSANFAAQTLVYNGPALSQLITGKGSSNGIFYYRVRACSVSCSPYATGANAIVVTPAPSAPSSIVVPANSATGSFTISWGGSIGVITKYELYEARSSSFSGQTLVHSAITQTIAFTDRANGSYYYRVRACNGGSCSAYTTGTSPIAVSRPPGTPASISVPASSTTGTYTISWGTSTGDLTAYQLYESPSSDFSAATSIYSGTGTSLQVTGRTDGTYYYRVRACNGPNCSGYRTGANGTVVLVAPGVPSFINYPSVNTTGTFDVTWGTATGRVTAYELYEARGSTFSDQVRIAYGAGLPSQVLSRADGVYYYRVRACNGTSCSDYVAGGALTVLRPPGPPSSIAVPYTNNTGTYTVGWATPVTGTATSYQLYEANNAAFTNETLVYNAAQTNVVMFRNTGTYYYRVRACNSSGCSLFTSTTDAHGVVVTLPPGSAPPQIIVPVDNFQTTYGITWAGVAGATRYELMEATNPGFSGETLIYNGPEVSYIVPVRPIGTYYYRVRACNAGGCGAYIAGSNGVTVQAPPTAPPPPTNLQAIQQADCSWRATWNASPGATSYRFKANNRSTQVVTTTTVSYNCPQGQLPNYRPQWVQACDGSFCSVQVNF